jgi:hypothetical protein
LKKGFPTSRKGDACFTGRISMAYFGTFVAEQQKIVELEANAEG